MNLYDYRTNINVFTTTFSVLNSILGFCDKKGRLETALISSPPQSPKMFKFVGTIKIFYFRVGPKSEQLRFFKLSVFCLGDGKLRGKGRIKIFARCH